MKHNASVRAQGSASGRAVAEDRDPEEDEGSRQQNYLRLLAPKRALVKGTKVGVIGVVIAAATASTAGVWYWIRSKKSSDTKYLEKNTSEKGGKEGEAVLDW